MRQPCMNVGLKQMNGSSGMQSLCVCNISLSVFILKFHGFYSVSTFIHFVLYRHADVVVFKPSWTEPNCLHIMVWPCRYFILNCRFVYVDFSDYLFDFLAHHIVLLLSNDDHMVFKNCNFCCCCFIVIITDTDYRSDIQYDAGVLHVVRHKTKAGHIYVFGFIRETFKIAIELCVVCDYYII